MDQLLDFPVREIVKTVARFFVGWKSKVDLGIGAGRSGEGSQQLVVGEPFIGIDKSSSRALRRVIKLNEENVEFYLIDHRSHIRVRNDTLWRTSDQILL
jgi:hypothetical protein